MDVAPKGLRLLSFDGGGLRGLAGPLIILEMMQRLMFDLELPKLPRPCDYFEMAIGSGTGGLSAILLGRLGFTIETAIYQYLKITKVAFSDIQIEPNQRVSNVRNVLGEVLKDAGLPLDAMMEGTDTVAGKCKIVICVASAGNIARVRLLRSYQGRAFHSASCTIIDAALATLSSSEFFEPISIEGIGASEDFVDGDISCSNPTLELLREAEDVFGSHIKVFSIISLGSGREIADATARGGATDTVARDLERHFNIACERTHEDLQRRTRNFDIYFRFNPGRDISSSQPREWKHVPFLKTQTTSYLQMEIVSQQIDAAVSTLHSNPNGVLLSLINTSTRQDFRNSVSSYLKTQPLDNFDSLILSQQKTAPAQGAMHEKCLQGTRRSILERIRKWGDLGQSSKPIFWLCDSAGTGKSTIAVTMGEEWRHSNCLAGQFCFSNSSASTSTAFLFFPTIAVDMASKIPELRTAVADAFKNDPMLANRGLAEQFEKLILEPVKKLSREVILIIDAVDECEAVSRNNLLKLLVQKLPLIPQLKIFITSRPEHDITPILEASAVVHTVEFQLQTTDIISNVDDISTYIHYYLSNILSKEQCQLLVKRANGLFIWASTAKRELETNDAFDSTGDIFARLMSSGDAEDLSLLYYRVLERVIPHPNRANFLCQVLGILVTIREPLSINSLEMFLPKKPVEKLMWRLRSVFNFKTRDDPILFFHPTFREYLLAGERAAFPINTPNSQLLIASQCFIFMENELKQDICRTGYSIGHLPNNKDNPNQITMLQSCVTIPLLYSVKYWLVHVESCIENEEIIDKILAFFCKNLLHWIETLSLYNQIGVGITGLYGLRKRIRARALEPSLNQIAQVGDWCHDTLQLVQTQQVVLELNAFAIYSIVVTCAPREGVIYKHYGQKSSGSAPKMLKGWRNKWPSHIVLSGHESSVCTLAISKDGTRIASGSDDKTLRIWDGVTAASLCDPIRHPSVVRAVAFVHNDSHVISGSDTGRIAIWDVATQNTVGPMVQGHTAGVYQIATSFDGMRSASASADNKLRLWSNWDNSAVPFMMEGHTGTVYSVTFSPDGTLIASGGYDNTVRLWDVMNGTSLGAPLRGHRECVHSVAFSPTGDLVASASWDCTLRLWNVKTRECIGSPFIGHSSWVYSVSFSPDGTKIASGSRDKTIRLWNVATGECISQLRSHTNGVQCVAFLPEGNRIASGSDDHTIRIWDLDVRQGEEETQTDSGVVTCTAFSPCGSKIVTCSTDFRLQVWSAENGDLVGEMKGHTREVLCLAFSPNGLTIASGSEDESLRLWSMETRKCFVVKNANDFVLCLAFSHDGKRIISGDAKLRLWDSKTGVEIESLFGDREHGHAIFCVAFSSDDARIVSGSEDFTVQLWSFTGERLHSYSHQSKVVYTTFSTDNLHVISACDEEVIVWEFSPTNNSNIARFPHFHSSPTRPLPAQIQHLKFDLTSTSDAFYQSCEVADAIQRYFSDPRLVQVSFTFDTRTIALSNSSSYLFHLPADLKVRRWKGNRGMIVFRGLVGQVTILDFSHLPL